MSGGSVLRIPGKGGRTVHALYAPATGDAPTIVHFHGNGEALADQVWLASAFHSRGLGFLAVEYPGYGLSGGVTPSERAIYEDAEAALAYLRDTLHVSAGRVVLQGQSLGTGVAVEAARRGHGARLVLVSPFTSMLDMARHIAPLLPARWLLQDRYETAAKAPGIRIPTLVIHGTDDELIPVAMSQRLAALFPDARLRLVEGAHHNDIWSVGDRLVEEIVAAVRPS